MAALDELVYDRDAADVAARLALGSKTIAEMTEDELGFYIYGDPTPLYFSDGEPVECTDGEVYIRDGIRRGEYGAADVNRVNTALLELQALLAAADYPVTLTDVLTDYEDGDDFTDSEQVQYLLNVAAILAAIPSAAGDIPTTLASLGWQGANAIEEAIAAIHLADLSIAESAPVMGDAVCGE